MIQQLPFTKYDFWAYLSAGFLLLFALDQASGRQMLMQENWPLVQAIIAVSMAYGVGHLVAGASSFLYEKILIGKLLGNPRNILFDQPIAWEWVQRLIPGYFEPLPAATQKAVLDKSGKLGIPAPGEALFWPAFSYARDTPVVMNRLTDFMNLYGFCRNISFVALIDSAIFYWSYLQIQGAADHLWWSRIALIVGVGMALRYLKFYRHYACELFTAYAYAKD